MTKDARLRICSLSIFVRGYLFFHSKTFNCLTLYKHNVFSDMEMLFLSFLGYTSGILDESCAKNLKFRVQNFDLIKVFSNSY